MSRSYKKHPVCNFVKPDGSWKKIYNRKVRRILDVPSGNWYRKLGESWNIHDWRAYGPSFESFCDSYARWHDGDRPARDLYDRCYRRK